jgi:hypothetical protein
MHRTLNMISEGASPFFYFQYPGVNADPSLPKKILPPELAMGLPSFMLI